jgi:hypothetical protein
VLLAKVVVRADPFTCTTDPLTKLLPLTVSVNPAPPAVALFGEMLDTEGAGLFTVKVTAPLVPAAGVFTG